MPAEPPPASRPDRAARRGEVAFALLVALAHLAVAGWAMWHHEMWRDELHSWVVARDSATPWDVVRNHSYDGHPPLWYLVLWIVTRFTWRPAVMQALHLAIASADVFLVARYAPFSRAARALFAFGYFAAYEYAAISRCYGLALLFVVLLCMQHRRRFERPVTTALLLAALALTTTVATIVAGAYAAALALDLLVMRERRPRAWLPIASAAIAGLAATAAAWPPADSTVAHVGDRPELPWSYGPTRIIAGLLPIPRPDFYYWNSNAILSWAPLDRAAPWLAVALAAWALYVLWPERAARVLFAVGAPLLVVLFAGVYSGDVRHHGFVFVLFLMGAWIGWERRRPSLAPTLAALLVVHVASAAIAIAYETRFVFSSGGRAAEAIRRANLADATLVAELDYPATAMLGQLGPHAVAYSPRTGRAFSFVRWTRDRLRDPSDAETLQFAVSMARSRGADVVLVMNRPLSGSLDGATVVPFAELVDSMIEAENFFLYRVRP